MLLLKPLFPWLFFGGVLLGHLPAIACLNTYHYNAFGRKFNDGIEAFEDNAVAGYTQYSERKQELLYKIEKEHDTSYQTLSDYAVMLIYLGETPEAKKILTRVEKRHPGEYNTAINLGTAYELLGQNDSALYWIKRGMEIFPGSHDGSEWIHVRVLEAKIALQRDPDWLLHHTVLGYDFGLEDQPEDLFAGRDSDGLLLMRQLKYQLNERLYFVKAPDPTAADLLFTLANVQAILDRPEVAMETYVRALTYGYQPAELARARRAWLQAHPMTAGEEEDNAGRDAGTRRRKHLTDNSDAASRPPKGESKSILTGPDSNWVLVLLLCLIPLVLSGWYAARREEERKY